MATPKNMIYEIEDTASGRVFEIEGPEGASEQDLYAAIQGYQEPDTESPIGAPPPLPAERQEVQTTVINSAGGSTSDPRMLSADQEGKYVAMARDPNVSYEQINSFLQDQARAAGQPASGSMISRSDLDRFRRELQEKPDADVSAVTYSDWRDQLGTPGSTLSEGDGFFKEVLRGFQQASQEAGLGLISRSLNDWWDTGGDIIDAKFPDASPEERERLQEEYVSWLQRGVRRANEEGVSGDRLVPWLLGQVLTPDPIDLIPFGTAARGASVASRIARKAGEGAAINAAADVGYQGADILQGVEDEFRGEQMALSALTGGLLQGGVQGIGEGASRALRGPQMAPESTSSISILQSRKNSKAYKQELVQTADDIIAYGQSITDQWSNSPEFNVHDNFTKLADVDNDALGYYDTRTGQVNLNTENIVREAQRLDTSVEDVVNATIFHESLGHYGLAQKFGEDLDGLLAGFIADGDASIRQRLDDWLAKNPEAYKGSPNRDILAMEEVLAQWSEGGPRVATLYDTIANYLKDLGRRMGLDLNFSEREVKAILAQAHNKVIKGDRSEIVGGSGNRYMQSRSPIRREDLTSDELFEAQNAYDILDKMTESYEPTVMSMDDLKAEAEARGFTASDLLKRSEISAGDIARRLMMYDIAMEKMDTKLTNLYAKIQGGEATAANRAEYAKTLFRFQELSARIFGQQSEAGRALRAIQELNYTRKKIEGLKGTLSEVNDSGFQQLMQDPEFFNKFAANVQMQLAESKQAARPSKFGNIALNTLNLPRAIMSSGDLSAPLRQGLFFIGRKEFWRAFPQMFKYAMSKESYNSMMREISSRKNYSLMVESGLPFSKADGKLSQREEDFMTEWAGKIPGYGKIVQGSERAYTGFLNKLRADVFDDLVSKFEMAGLDVEGDKKLLKDLGGFIGNATGRGDLGKFMNSAAPVLNATFFSPRLIASRVRLLNPAYYASLSPLVRQEALKSLLSFGAIASSVLGLSALAGANVEIDPRSSDFGKIKAGDTRFDILGGFSQYLTLGARLFTGERKTGTGEIVEYGNEYGQTSKLDATATFFRNKLAPIPSFFADFLDGQNSVGDDFEMTSAIKDRMVPMYSQDALEAIEAYGPGLGMAVAAPGVFGVGVSTYKPYALDPEAQVDAPSSFKDSELEDGENDYISVSNGKVTLKPETKEMWQERLNSYVELWMGEEMANPEWGSLSDEEKAKVIAEVRKDAREQAKEDMLDYLQLN